MRLSYGPDKGGYYHEYFLWEREYLCDRIKRVRIKGTGTRSASNPDDEPGFYDMPFLGPINAEGVAFLSTFMNDPKFNPPAYMQKGMQRHVSLSGDKVVKGQITSIPLETSVKALPQSDFSEQCSSSASTVLMSQPVLDKKSIPDLNLDESFWGSIEEVMGSMSVPSSTTTEPNVESWEMEPLPIKSILVANPERKEAANSSSPFPMQKPGIAKSKPYFEAKSLQVANLKLDDDVASFLQALFSNEKCQKSATIVTKQCEAKGISTDGWRHAVGWKRKDAFKSQKLFRASAA